MVTMQPSSSSQANSEGGASSFNCPLLPAWGSQEHTNIHSLIDPEDVAPFLCGSIAAAEQLGDYLDAAAAPAGYADAHAAAQNAKKQQDRTAQNQSAAKEAGPQEHSAAGEQHMHSLQGQQPQVQYQQLYLQQQQHVLDPAGFDCQQDYEQLNWKLRQQHYQQHYQRLEQEQQAAQMLMMQQQQQPPCQAVQCSDQAHAQCLANQQQQQPQQQLKLEQPRNQLPAARSSSVPGLDLSRVKVGSSSPVRNLAPNESVSPEVAEREAELCFEGGSIQQLHLHPNAPLQDNRCYIYRAVGRKELSNLHDLLSRLPERECSEVLALWDGLMVARHDCEVMAARGVRVSRDISRDWQETVSDLIDRVVAQDNELGQLRQQLKAAQVAAAGAAGAASAAAAAAGQPSGIEELHAQVVRLKRQRDRLTRDQQELSRALAEAQEAAQLASHEAAAAKDQLASVTSKAKALRDQHTSLLRQHIELAAYTESLEAAALENMLLPCSPTPMAAAAAGEAEGDQPKPDQACKSPGGSFIVSAKASTGRRSPFGSIAAGAAAAVAAAAAGMPGQQQQAGSHMDGQATAGAGSGRISPSPGQGRKASRSTAALTSSASSKASPRSGTATFHLGASGIAAAFGHKLTHAAAAALAGSRSERSSASSTPSGWAPGAGNLGSLCRSSLGPAAAAAGKAAPTAAGDAVSVATAAGGAAGGGSVSGSKPRNSDDTPDTAPDRIGSSHTQTMVCREWDQLPGLGVLGGVVGGKGPSRLLIQTAGCAGAVALQVPGVVGVEVCYQQDWRGAIEEAQQQLEAVSAMSF